MILNLSRNSIEDLSPLQNLKQLKIVDLSDNGVKNLDCFEGFEELVNLKV
jgi:Leucine-rich repeat (LRR) protein